MSNDKGKLFVFDRKELILLVFFFLIMAITSFVFGIRLGKKQATEFSDHNLTQESTEKPQALEAKSEIEQNAQEISTEIEKPIEESVHQQQDHITESGVVDEPKTSTGTESAGDLLKKEFEKIESADYEIEKTKQLIETEQPVNAAEVKEEKNDVQIASKEIIGKFTIQLGSYKTIDEAKQFANGFLIKGYKPLINEVSVPTKGTWYRVSVGVFNSIAEAKQYIKKEDSLFNSQEYVVTEIR